MSKILLRAWFGVFVFACILGLALSRHSSLTPAFAVTPTPAPLPYASATPTPPSPALSSPGQTITNAASATYTDGTNTYNILSNTVTVYVQNAPTLVVLTNNGSSNGTNSIRYPGDITTDYYTIVNTGNGSGNFTLATAAQASPTPLPTTNSGTGSIGVVSGVSYDVSCTGGATLNDIVTTIAALNTDLANAACTVAANGSVSIAVTYDPTIGNNPAVYDGSQLEAQISYTASGSGYAAASSLWASNYYRDPVYNDERVDVQKSPNPIASDGTVTFAVTVNNGGNGTANYVNNYGTTCGGTVTVCGPALTGAGVLIADKIPTNASGTPLPVVSMSPSPGPQALPTGTTITMVYTTDTTAVTGWTVKPAATFPPTAAYVGIFMTGSPTNYALGADPTPAAAPTTGPGSVSALSSQIGWSLQLGPVPANLSVSNIVTAPVGDNKGCIEGPGLTTTSTACDPNGPNGPGGNPAIPLSTAPPSPSAPGPGLSNTAQVFTPSLYNGPLGQPDAKGCFNSNATPVPFPTWSPMPNPFPTISPTTSPTCGATPDTNDDFTEAVATPNPSNTNMPYGSQMPAAASVTVTNAIKNPGTQPTTYQLIFPTLPSTVTVSSVTYGPASCSTTSTPAAGVYPLGSIGAGASIQYCVTYATTTGASAPYYFQPQYVQLRVGYTAAPTVYYNDTWNILMPGGFVELVKTANILTPGGGSAGNCTGVITGGLPALGVCPGGLIQYAVTYFNTLPATASGSPAEPAGATVAMTGNLVITEDGAANGSNWTTYTGGMFDPAGSGTVPLVAGQTLASLAANCGLVTLKCGDTSASAVFGGGASPNGNLYGSTHFTDSIPAAGITPQSVGTLMFAAKVH